MTDLGVHSLSEVYGLPAIVGELANLRDAAGTPRFSRGLLIFLKRLATEPGLSNPIKEWLCQNAATQAADLAEIDYALWLESEKKILLVVVRIDERTERISAYQPFLRYLDGSPVLGKHYEEKAVATWNEFQHSLKKDLHEFVHHGELSGIQIHFVVPLSLLNKAFHQIPAPGGGMIGEKVVVVLRPAIRIFANDDEIWEPWRDYAKELRSKKPGTLKWMAFRSGQKHPSSGKGLYRVEFVIASRKDKDAVSLLIRTGAPVIYFPIDDWDKPEWSVAHSELSRLSRSIQKIDELPSEFYRSRIAGDNFACKGTLVWDDPSYNPFIRSVGPRR